MDDFLAAIGILLAFVYLTLPIVGLILGFSARKRLATLEQENREAQEKLAWLYGEQKAHQKRIAELEARRPVAAAGAPVAAPTPEPATFGLPNPTTPADTEAPTRPELPAASPPAAAPPPPAADDASATVPPGPPRAPAAAPPPPPRPAPAAPGRPLEQSVATWFTRIGAGALLLGALYFFKYAADNEWIGPMGRVLIGVLAGLGLVVTAEIIRPRTKEAFVHALIGVGLAVLYVSAWASSSLYELVPTEAAFAANTVIVGLGAALSYRHKGEAILVLVAVAGFLNPVLLSTGVDRPLALFAYLLLLTSGVLFVAVHHGFRVALFLSIFGVAVIYAGWYEKYFKTFDLRGQSEVDAPDEQLVGAYHALSARIVPLTFTGLFLLQWLATAFWLRAKGERPGWVKPVAVLGLVLAHIAATSLLIDRPVPLGVAVVVLAGLSVVSLTVLEAKSFLLLPMLAVFFSLLGHTAAREDQGQIGLLYLVGAWSGIYVLAFLRDQAGRFVAPSPRDARLAWLALAAFQVLSLPLLLPPPHEANLAAAGAITVAGLLVAVIAALAQLPGMAIGSTVFGAVLLAFAATVGGSEHTLVPPPAVEPAFLLLALVHAAGHLAASWWCSLQGERPRPITVVGVILPGLTFLGLSILTTSDEVPTLRALFTALVGVADLGLAFSYVRRGPAFDRHSSALAALALGLFAPALAFGFSGVTITVLWAALFVVAYYLAQETRSPTWLVVALLLSLATLVRLFAIDIGETEAELSRWYGSGGRLGIYRLPVLFNPRAYGLLGVGLASLVAAFVLSRPSRAQVAPGQVSTGNLRVLAAGLAVAGYAGLTALVISEVRGALVELPAPPPMPLDWEELNAFWSTVTEARHQAAGLVNMSTTMILALVAILLLAAGFALKDTFHRYLGLLVFLGTIAKLVAWDVWNLPRIYQVGVLTVVGVLLLGSGFLYARLKVLFTAPDETPPGPPGSGTSGAALSLLFLLLWPSALRAEEPPRTAKVAVERFEKRGAIANVAGPGDYRVPIDSELYAASKTEQLFADLRVADPDGHEVPYDIEPTAARIAPSMLRGTMYDPGAIEGEGYRATFELPEGTEHCLVQLELSGGSDYLRRTIIETGPGPNDLTQVSKGGVVYSVAGRGREDNELRYPRSLARYVRVTLLPDPDAQATTIEGALFGCAAPEVIAPTRSLPLKIIDRKHDAEQKTTTWTFDAGLEGVPIDELHFEVATPELARRVELAASSYQNAWPLVASGVLYRVAGNQDRPERLSLRFSTVRKRWWQLTVIDRDDAPIELTSATGIRREDVLLFRASRPGPYTVYVGDPRSQAPSYELSALLENRRGWDNFPTLGLTALEPNPEFGKAPDRSDLPVTERYRTAIGWGLAVVLLLLSGWAVRVLRRPTSPTG